MGCMEANPASTVLATLGHDVVAGAVAVMGELRFGEKLSETKIDKSS